jgi:hypothetical protein
MNLKKDVPGHRRIYKMKGTGSDDPPQLKHHNPFKLKNNPKHATVNGKIKKTLTIDSLWFLIPAAVLGVNTCACMYLWRKSFAAPHP